MSGAGGTLIFSGSDSYSGGTNVSAGTLIVTSQTALPDGSALSVGAGGMFVFDPMQAFAAPIESLTDVPSGRVVSAVPEPGTLELLVIGVAAAAIAAGIRLKMSSCRPRLHYPRMKNGDNLLDLAC